MQALIDKGADPNIRGRDGTTPVIAVADGASKLAQGTQATLHRRELAELRDKLRVLPLNPTGADLSVLLSLSLSLSFTTVPYRARLRRLSLHRDSLVDRSPPALQLSQSVPSSSS